MSRKYSLTRIIGALREQRGLISLAADALGCTRQTIYTYAAQYPQIEAVIAEERQRRVDVAERGLDQALEDRQPWAIALVLKTLGKERGYGDRPVVATPATDQEDLAEWPQIQSAILRALENHPDAKWAVIEALKAMEPNGSSNGAY